MMLLLKFQEITEIVANIVDSDGELVKMGEVIFTIGDESYSASVSNGIAKLM